MIIEVIVGISMARKNTIRAISLLKNGMRMTTVAPSTTTNGNNNDNSSSSGHLAGPQQ